MDGNAVPPSKVSAPGAKSSHGGGTASKGAEGCLARDFASPPPPPPPVDHSSGADSGAAAAASRGRKRAADDRYDGGYDYEGGGDFDDDYDGEGGSGHEDRDDGEGGGSGGCMGVGVGCAWFEEF